MSRRAVAFAVALAPPVAAAGLVLLSPQALRDLASDTEARLLLRAVSGLTVVGPLLVAAAAWHFNQGRVAAAAMTTAFVAAMSDESLACAPTPSSARVLATLATAALLAAAPLTERGLVTRWGGLRVAALLAAFAVPAWLLTRHPAAVDAIARASGPLAGQVPGTPLTWGALVLLLAATLVLVRLGGDDGPTVGATLLGSLIALLAGLAAAARTTPALDVPLAPAAFFLASTATLGLAVHRIAWRHGYLDELTGLPSRRALDERLAALSGRYAIVIVDVDHFKRFNDEHGHAAGDAVLRRIARSLEAFPDGRAYRQGGEEFALVCPGRTLADLARPLDELRARIAAERVPLAPALASAGTGAGALAVTVSMGAAERSDRHATPLDVIRAADGSMLRAKSLGRNRVELA